MMSFDNKPHYEQQKPHSYLLQGLLCFAGRIYAKINQPPIEIFDWFKMLDYDWVAAQI